MCDGGSSSSAHARWWLCHRRTREVQVVEASAMVVVNPYPVPAGAESNDSDDDDGWDIGAVSPEEQGFDEPVHVDNKQEALKRALGAGNLPVVDELLCSGVNVESNLKFGWTPLMYAASVPNVDLMRLLLDRGANASYEKNNYTVLMISCAAHAAEEEVLKCVELLLSRNADPNARCNRKMTPLMYAAREGYIQVIAVLVAHGAEINAQDKNGFTALTWAARHGHKKAVFKLLSLGADKSIQTKDGQTAGDVAKNNQHSELYSFLCLSANPLRGIFQNLTKKEAMRKLLESLPGAVSHSSSGFGDVEMFLHSLGLEYLGDIIKQRDITLRRLVTMGKEELTEIGVKDTDDQQKILNAVREVHVEELVTEDLPAVRSLELSADECLCFLMQLNRHCIHLTAALQSFISQFPKDASKVTIQWNSSEKMTKVCDDLVLNAADMNDKIITLNRLMHKLYEGQKEDPCRIPPQEAKGPWKKTFYKMAVCIFVMGVLVLKRCRV